MQWLHYVSWFVGGAMFINAIPHSVSALQGRPFQSPFAKPPGEGLSSAVVNYCWGFGNLLIAYLLILQVGSFDLRNARHALALGLGMVVAGLLLARHFARFHGGDLKGTS